MHISLVFWQIVSSYKPLYQNVCVRAFSSPTFFFFFKFNNILVSRIASYSPWVWHLSYLPPLSLYRQVVRKGEKYLGPNYLDMLV